MSIAILCKTVFNNRALLFRVNTLKSNVPEEVRNLGRKREEPYF